MRSPLLLAIETSGPRGSVALGFVPHPLNGAQVKSAQAELMRPGAGHPEAGGGVNLLAEAALGAPRAHASSLLPTIERLLEECGIDRRGIGGVLVGSGPGSFTGLRIAAASARGLARGLGVPLWVLPSIQAAALAGAPLPSAGVEERRHVLFDARGDRVYGALFLLSQGALREVIPPYAGTIDALPGGGAGEVTFLGDGAHLHRAALEARGEVVLDAPAGIPTAGALLELLALDPERQPEGEGSRWEPLYLRGSSARKPTVRAP